MLYNFKTKKISISSNNKNLFNYLKKFKYKIPAQLIRRKVNLILFNYSSILPFNIDKIKKNNSIKIQYPDIKIYKLNSNIFFFSFYSDKFYLYLNVDSNLLLSFVIDEKNYGEDFFVEFIIQPAFNLYLSFLNKYFFHSALLSINHAGIMIMGSSGSGKSTLSLLLLTEAEHFNFLTDDKTVCFSNARDIKGYGYNTYLSVKNSELPVIKNKIAKLNFAFAIGKCKFYNFAKFKNSVKINYIIFTSVKPKQKTEIISLNKSKFYYELFKNSYPLNYLENRENYIDFLIKIINKTKGFKINLGYDADKIDFFKELENCYAK